MEFLLDANILCRLVRPDDPQHLSARQAVDILLQQHRALFVTPQIEREFWVVATRPRENNGLGFTPKEALEQLKAFERISSLRPDTATVHENWKQLVSQHQVMGKKAHDAGHVAAMQVHGIRNVLTFDAGDFTRYEPLIVVWTPEQVVQKQTHIQE